MVISAIVAKGNNNIIGIKNKLPWYLPGDLKWFKEKTLNRHVIMGRKSFESLPYPLPQRINIVVTRDKSFFKNHCIIRHSIEEALAYAHAQNEEEVFILGGGRVYAQTSALWDRLYLTDVDASPEGDTFFPNIDYCAFKLTFEDFHQSDDKNEFSYTFRVYERIRCRV